MKLSSISLIAAALAATAGSATPISHHPSAHASRQVNSFQSDLDPRESAVVGLERRGISNPQASHSIRGSASVNRQSAAMAREAGEKEPHWNHKADKLEQHAKRLTEDARKYDTQYKALSPKDIGPKAKKADMAHAAERQRKATNKADRAHNVIHNVLID